MLEIEFGDGVQGGFLPLVSSSLFLFMGLQSQISISMLEAKPLGSGGRQPGSAGLGLLLLSQQPSFLPSSSEEPEAPLCWECTQAATIPPACLKVDGQCHREGQLAFFSGKDNCFIILNGSTNSEGIKKKNPLKAPNPEAVHFFWLWLLVL